MPDPEELKAEANNLYAQARTIEDDSERLGVVLRALELEMAAETSVFQHPADSARKSA